MKQVSVNKLYDVLLSGKSALCVSHQVLSKIYEIKSTYIIFWDRLIEIEDELRRYL